MTISFLEQLNRLNIERLRLGTENVLNILELLGYPQEITPTIHIAGTNGKGSVTHMTTAGLLSQGLKVGSIHSPHLVHPRERICLNNEPLAEEAFNRYGHGLWTRLTQCLGPFKSEDSEWPTYFEFMVILAFVVFKAEHVDITVLETGLGGRLDASNVVSQPILTVITSIGYDHMDRLGDSLEAIAFEKAGILRAGTPLVLGPAIPEDALNVIHQVATQTHVESIIETTHDVLTVESALTPQHTQQIRNMVSGERIELGLLGGYQVQNLATVLGILSVLQRQQIVSDTAAFRDALAHCQWKGRFEYRPTLDLLLDGGHNEDGFNAIAQGLAETFPTQHLYWMLALRQNRPISLLIKLLEKFAHRTQAIFITCPRHENPHLFHAPQLLRQQLRNKLPALAHQPIWASSDPQTAWWMLERLMKGQASDIRKSTPPLTVVAGSLYQLGDLYEIL